MRYRMLGRTGLEVSELALGGLFLASFAAEREEARRAVHRAVALGVNYIDTAPGYYDSDAAVGHALAGLNEPLILSTKLGGRPQPFDPRDKDGLPELGLRFAISNFDISTVLMGARSVAEVEANVRAVAAGPLPPDLLAELQAIADMVPFRPFEEPFSLPFGRPEPLRPGIAN